MWDWLDDRRTGWLVASIAASLAFYVWRDALSVAALPIAKGVPVALLAVWAWSWTRAGTRTVRGLPDAWRIALVMAFGALGDGLIELDLQWGALAFFAGHVASIALYLRHRREALSPSQKATAAALLVLTPLIAFMLPADRATGWQAAVYAFSLGGMAAAAWASSFSRYRVGVGAVLFVASDLLIFARLGPLATSSLPDMLIWPVYYTGQLLISIGVIDGLRKAAGDQSPLN